ncbi:MAG: glucosamine-6-phosphate deaminase, partial [bacterium]|nr:glucosamine-6-phosphate deaminase [bacterium]MDW8163455.1 glucosamine-6-phosphate deaminase [Candidatus Omnitrophota bacterium]
GRKIEKLKNCKFIPFFEKEKILVDISYKLNKKITEISLKDVENDIFGKVLIEKGELKNLKEVAKKIEDNFKYRVLKGIQEIENTTFLHTAPHHDDIMLGYLPYILHLVRKPSNRHFFVTLTSGFTSVTNNYLMEQLENLEKHIEGRKLDKLLLEKNYFGKTNITGKNRDIYRYLDGVAGQNEEIKKEAEARRMYRNLVELVRSDEPQKIINKIFYLKQKILKAYPGKRDIPDIQKLKGMIREWEEELLWAHLGFGCDNIFHLRLGFYTGEIFTPQPEWERDVKPFLKILKKINPDVITVAFDPEGTGPDTHYKVLQIITQSVKSYCSRTNKRIKIWG